MFASPIMKSNAKTAALSNAESLLPRSARRLCDLANKQSPFRAASASLNAGRAPDRDEPNFGKIPIHVPECQNANSPHGKPDELPHSPDQRQTPKEPRVPPPKEKGAKSPAPPEAVITSQTVADEPGARTRTTIGVGEEVNLAFSAGNTHWVTTAGKLSSARGPATTLTAPDTAGQVTVTAGTATITFTVVAPNILYMQTFPGIGVSHTRGRPDSGIQTTSFLGPDTVNFYNIKYREVNVDSIGSGVYRPFDKIGHDPHPKTIHMRDNVVAGMGTQSRVKDRACSGDPATPAPFESGSLLYIIPNEYQLGDGPFHHFAYVTQMSMFNADNLVLYTYKAGARGLTTVGSRTNEPEVCDNPAGVTSTGSAEESGSMFAPQVAKGQTKTVASSTAGLAPQDSTFVARRLDGVTAEQGPMLQKSIGNQPTFRSPDDSAWPHAGDRPDDKVGPDPEQKHARAPGSGLSWNFSSIPMRPPDRASGPQPLSSLAATPLPHVMQKLVVGQADDPLEHEADRAAAQVMRMAVPETSRVPVQLSRKCVNCEEEEAEQSHLQRAGLPGSSVSGAPPIVHELMRTPGHPLDGDSAAFFGTRFGHDFARVRVHHDGEAAEAAKSVKARAYTIGDHIFFGGGEYAPATNPGRLLLAHELAHVVQQSGSRAPGLVQRREVDDRSCAGLSDVEADVNNHVNAEIGAARTAAGTSPPALLQDV